MMPARSFIVPLALFAVAVTLPPDLPRARGGGNSYAAPDTDTTEKRIAVVTGDSLIGTDENGEPVQLFLGFRGRQDSTFLRAARAKRFVRQDRVLFEGDVLVVDKGDSLFADKVFYDETVKTGQATGNVRLTDGDVVAYAPSGTYFIDEKRAVFTEGLRLVDSAAVITGAGGTYWTEEMRAEVAGNVQLQAKRTHLEADSLTYDREKETALARGNVFIERLGAEGDSTRRTLLFSNWAFNDEPAGYSLVRGFPTLVQLRTDSVGTDTLVVTARELASTETDSLRRLVANGGARYSQADYAAVADSMVHETADADSVASVARTELFGNPTLWVGASQVTGDTVVVLTVDDEVDSLLVRGNAFVARRDSVTERVHQAKARMLAAGFEDDSTRTFVLTGNAETIWFRRDGDGEPDGALHVSGDEAVFRFRGDDLEDLAFGSHQGTYYPESALPDPFELDGFSWAPQYRPVKAELLGDRRVLEWLECDADAACRGLRGRSFMGRR